MKKFILTMSIVLVFTFVFLFTFRGCASATDVVSSEHSESQASIESQTEGQAIEEENFDLKLYIKERIVPVVVGVLTAIAGLLSTIISIKRSVRSLTNLKNSFSEEKAEREASLADNKKLLQEEVARLQNQTKDLPKMKEKVEQLSEQIGTMGQMLQLAYSADVNLVKTGKAKKMELLVAKMKPKEENLNDEATI